MSRISIEAKVKDINRQNCRSCSHWSRQECWHQLNPVKLGPPQENVRNDTVPSDIRNLITASLKNPSIRYVPVVSPLAAW